MIGGGAQKITVEIGGKIAASLTSSIRTAQMQVSSLGRNVSRTMNDAAISGRKGFKSMLDSAGIWSTIRNEYMSAIYPIGTMPAQIVVREEDYEKAKAMLHHR